MRATPAPRCAASSSCWLCWFDLTTNDAAGAKRFYSELLGWSYEDFPSQDGGTYSMARIRGRDVAAIMSKPQSDQTPTHWNSYVLVKSADETVKQASSLGGKVLMEPFDVMDAGRMAVLQDPSGAVFCIWQAGKHDGTRVAQEPGSFTWAELSTRDVTACRDFYTKLFNWSVHQYEGGPMQYWMFNANDKDRGGMMKMSAEVPAQVPPSWTIYFNVADCDGSVNRAQKMGGKLVVPAMDVPGTGRFALVSDPQGSVFGVLQPAR
jgi:predicted enzyme related to lactoylglutathione lyase